MIYVYIESANFPDSYVDHVGTNEPLNLTDGVRLAPSLHTRLIDTGLICSLIKPAAVQTLISFPPKSSKIQSVML